MWLSGGKYNISVSKKKDYGLPKPPKELPCTKNPIFDMHCHLDMTVDYIQNIAHDIKVRKPNLDPVEVPDLKELVNLSFDANVRGLLHCACDLENIKNISNVLDILKNSAEEYFKDHQEVQAGNNSNNYQIYGACAIHPNESALHEGIVESGPDGLIPKLRAVHEEYDLDSALQVLFEVIKNDQRIRVIGETGLDFFRTSETGIDAQIKSFRSHIQLAKDLDLPLQIHDRQAHDQVLKILDSDIPPQIVLLHSFSGDENFAKECVQRGFYASFSGPVSFKANDDLRKALDYYFKNAPELILSETDCPFLTAEPNRGRPNAPSFMSDTIRFMSSFLEVDVIDFCNLISRNSQQIFNSSF